MPKIIFLLFSLTIFLVSMTDIATSAPSFTCNNPRTQCSDLMQDGACYPNTTGSPQNTMLCDMPGGYCGSGSSCCGTIPCPAPH
jgi:hypothetical protein